MNSGLQSPPRRGRSRTAWVSRGSFRHTFRRARRPGIAESRFTKMLMGPSGPARFRVLFGFLRSSRWQRCVDEMVISPRARATRPGVVLGGTTLNARLVRASAENPAQLASLLTAHPPELSVEGRGPPCRAPPAQGVSRARPTSGVRTPERRRGIRRTAPKSFATERGYGMPRRGGWRVARLVCQRRTSRKRKESVTGLG